MSGWVTWKSRWHCATPTSVSRNTCGRSSAARRSSSRAAAGPSRALVPIKAGGRVLTPEQQAIRQQLLDRMRRGIDLGERTLPFDRDALHER